MNGIVVDASMTLSWCFPDEQSPASLDLLERLRFGAQAVVPSFWMIEVLNSPLVGERRGRIAPEQTKAFFDNLRNLMPVIDHLTLEQVTGPLQVICRDHQLPPYDALYLELAQRSGYPLATSDRRQQGAAHVLGIRCL